MQTKEILVVDDEPGIRGLISASFSKMGFRVVEAADVPVAQARLAEHLPDIILLDWMMSKVSGIEFAEALRSDPCTKHIPIILLTARSAENDKIAGLNTGVDDYVTKPFSLRELAARVHAVLRRSTAAHLERPLNVQGLILDPESHRVSFQNATLHIGPTEYRLLELFMRNPERIFTRQQILEAVWNFDAQIEDRTVDVHIRRLRQVLEQVDREHLIQTLRAIGYRLSAQGPLNNTLEGS